LSESERKNTLLNDAITKVYDQFYDRVHVLQNIQHNYTDSVLAIDYDPALYPLSDTTWKYLGLVEAKIDANASMEVDFTKYLLDLDRVLFIVSYNLSKTNKAAWKELAKIA